MCIIVYSDVWEWEIDKRKDGKSMKHRKQWIALVVAAMIVAPISETGVAKAAGKTKLNKKKVTLEEGESSIIKLKKNKKKVKWSVSKKKIVSLKVKNKNTVTITAKKAGKAKVVAKVGKKKYTCNIIVEEKPTESPTPTPVVTVQPPVVNTTVPTATAPIVQVPGVSNNPVHTNAPGQTDDVVPTGTPAGTIETAKPASISGLIVAAESTNEQVQGISIYSKDNVNLIEVFGDFKDIRDVIDSITYTYANDEVTVVSSTYSPESYFSDGKVGHYQIQVQGELNGEEVTQTYFLGRAGKFSYTGTEEDGMQITRYVGWAKQLAIPEKLGGKIVTSIDSWTFYKCSSLTEIKIPEDVTSISYLVFLGCSSLEKIIVAKGNEVYDSRGDCNAIIETETNSLINGCKNTIIPESVTSIGDYAFAECSSLIEINIPESVTSIGYSAFKECSSLIKINIPESVTSIDYGAFSGCSSLTEIYIPKSVMSIDWCVFEGCSSLEKIIVAEGNEVYDSRGGCNGIIETQTNSLISGCKNTIIPESVTSIGDYAFSGCSNLIEIKIPEGVTSIDYSAFLGCSSLAEITIPESVTSIDGSAFSGCSSLIEINIPESVTSICSYVFWKCSSLIEITIPESVTSIDYGAFSGCSSLMEINIPESVTSIGEYAFNECSSLTKINIPESVTEIDFGVFMECRSLTEIIISGSVTSIDGSAFSGCSSLAEITIPESVTLIGYSAFSGCNENLLLYVVEDSYAHEYAVDQGYAYSFVQ